MYYSLFSLCLSLSLIYGRSRRSLFLCRSLIRIMDRLRSNIHTYTQTYIHYIMYSFVIHHHHHQIGKQRKSTNDFFLFFCSGRKTCLCMIQT